MSLLPSLARLQLGIDAPKSKRSEDDMEDAKRPRTSDTAQPMLPSLVEYYQQLTQDKLPPFKPMKFPIRESAHMVRVAEDTDIDLITAKIAAKNLVACLHWSSFDFSQESDEGGGEWTVGSWVTSWRKDPSSEDWTKRSNTVQFHTSPSWHWTPGRGESNKSLIVLYVGKDDVQHDEGFPEWTETRDYGTTLTFGVVATNVFGFVFKTEKFAAGDKREVNVYHVMQACNDEGEFVRFKYDANDVLDLMNEEVKKRVDRRDDDGDPDPYYRSLATTKLASDDEDEDE